MVSSIVKFFDNGSGKVVMNAFKTDIFLYKAIGTTINVYHKEMGRVLWVPGRGWKVGSFGRGGVYAAEPQETWQPYYADSISIVNNYSGLLPSISPSAASRACSSRNSSVCDCRLWAVGLGISIPASSGGGGPDIEGSTPSASASLEVRSVTGHGTVVIKGQVINIGDVEAT